MNITIEYYILELVDVPHFNLKKQFWVFWPNFHKNSIFSLKQKNWVSPSNTAFRIRQCTKTPFKQKKLNFWSKPALKGFSGLKKKKWTSSLFLHIRVRLNVKFHIKQIIQDIWSKYIPKGIVSLKKKKWAPLLKAAYYNYAK